MKPTLFRRTFLLTGGAVAAEAAGLGFAPGKLIDIQGNYDSPVNQGTLCPKGAAPRKKVTTPWASSRWERHD